MKLPQPILRGTLIRRYKRFLADIALENGDEITAHCANPGAMTGLNMPGLPVYVTKASNPNRKLKWNFELVEIDNQLVGINTSNPNKIVGEALSAKTIPALAAYNSHRPEVKYGENSRIDFLLSETGLPDCYLEVKNVHFCRAPGLAEFPDSGTARGMKHLRELTNMVRNGHRAINLYLVQRQDCTHFTLAADIDPAYAAACTDAIKAGVEIMCFDCSITLEQIILRNALPISQSWD